MSIGGKVVEGNGIATTIELAESSIHPGALCLRRRMVGLAYRPPPPGCLPPFDGWQATGDGQTYELNLGIPSDEEENVTVLTLKEYASSLATRADWSDGDQKLKRFDYAIRRLLVSVLRIFEPTYGYGLAGLITPQNVLLVSWPGWAGREGTEFATEIVLADVGIYDLSMSTMPHWLEEDCKYAFLWDYKPEEMLGRNRYDAAVCIRAMARLLADVLEPGLVRGVRPGVIPASELKVLKAEVWTKLANALNPQGGYAKLPALDGWKKFTRDVYESGPSRHFVFGKSAPIPIPPPSEPEPVPPSGGWRTAILLVSLLVVVVGGGSYAYLNWPPDPKCECCDFISHKSRLFTRLKRFDEARRGGFAKNEPTAAPELQPSGASPSVSSASLTSESSAKPAEYQRGPMFAGQFEMIRELHHAAEDDGFQFDEEERACLRKLRDEYYEALRLETVNLRTVFGLSVKARDAKTCLNTIQRELAELRALAAAMGESDLPRSWERGIQHIVKATSRKKD